MSVDNFYKTADIREYMLFTKSILDTLKMVRIRFISKKKLFNNIQLRRISSKKNNSLHVYQSTYAQQHLLKEGIQEMLPLSDYINTEFISTDDCKAKENIVLYNPAKGLKFTEKVIACLPNVIFIPLKGLNRTELNSLFKKAKLYIDFGGHPGKDRLPREAAINQCCVITGIEGAARFFQDIPIGSMYKFESKINQIPIITNLILDILDNYSNHIDNFSFYRSIILREQAKFYKEIDTIFVN